jgi:hypothetical protein
MQSRERIKERQFLMGNTDALMSPNLTSTIIIAGSIALAAVVVFAGSAAAPQSAMALPQYAIKEHTDCGYCHVDPDGGGARNAKGKNYEANGHTFKKTRRDSEGLTGAMRAICYGEGADEVDHLRPDPAFNLAWVPAAHGPAIFDDHPQSRPLATALVGVLACGAAAAELYRAGG